MFLESSISTSNLPKSSKMYLRRYWRNRQPVLANSPTGIGQFANRYWRNRQPVLANSPTGIGQIANRYWPNRQPVLANSPTGIGQFANLYWSNRILFLVRIFWSLKLFHNLRRRLYPWNKIHSLYVGYPADICPGYFFENSSQIYILRWRPFPSNKIHSPSGGYPANVTGISGYLLQIDYRKWNFPMTQSVCCSVRWFIVLSVGRPVGLS